MKGDFNPLLKRLKTMKKTIKLFNAYGVDITKNFDINSELGAIVKLINKGLIRAYLMNENESEEKDNEK